MNITVRIPTEQYAYIEVSFDSIEEYQEKYVEFAKTVSQVRKKVRAVEENEAPFTGKEYALGKKSALNKTK